jgi:hypothetical protein
MISIMMRFDTVLGRRRAARAVREEEAEGAEGVRGHCGSEGWE